MEIHVSFFELLKLVVKSAYSKILQYRLATDEYEIIETASGKVKGVKRKTIYDDYFYAFEGIPFAEPPIGELRFRAPQPSEKWNHVLDCTRGKSKPLQKHFVFGLIEGSEDCLYLNVYAKELKTDRPLPVMVWIHGGGFQIGEASRDLYAPDYFMMEEVILVTISYRLGALGFLSLEDPDLNVPGNAGLKDQVMALRWIKENISCFNGDANNITLFGESAGSVSTNSMMIAPKAKDTFHKAILQSGSIYCNWAFMEQRNWPYRLACALGFGESNDDKAVYSFLSKVDGKKIVSTDNKLLNEEERKQLLLWSFAPTIEPYESEDSVITRPLSEAMKTAWGNDIPVIMGYNSYEGLFSFQQAKYNPSLINDLGDCTTLVPRDAKLHLDENELLLLGQQIKKEFFNNEEPNIENHFHQYLDYMSYYNMSHAVYRLLRARLSYQGNNLTYLYRFDFDSAFFNAYRILACGQKQRGTCHADDLSYLFYNIASFKLSKESREFRTIQRMIGMWTSFASTSDPNTDMMEYDKWEPVTSSESIKCLNINDELEFIDIPEQKKFDFFDAFYGDSSLF